MCFFIGRGIPQPPMPPTTAPGYMGYNTVPPVAYPSSASTTTLSSSTSTTSSSTAPSSTLPVITPTIRNTIDALSPTEMDSILLQLKALATNQPTYARDLLIQSPMLAHSILLMLSKAQGLRIPPQSSSSGGSSSHTIAPLPPANIPPPPMPPNLLPPPGGFMIPPPMPPSIPLPPMPPSSMYFPPPPLPPSNMPTTTISSTPQGLPVAPSSSGGSDQNALIKRLLTMSDAEVAGLPAEERGAAEQIRLAIRTPLEVIYSLPPQERDMLLQLRKELEAALQ